MNNKTILQTNLESLGAVCVVARFKYDMAELHARDVDGATAVFKLTRFGQPTLVEFKCGESYWSHENHNARFRKSNTIKKADAVVRAARMQHAADARATWLREEASTDPRLRMTQWLVHTYQAACCIRDLRVELARTDSDADPRGDVAGAARRLVEIETVRFAEDHPWDSALDLFDTVACERGTVVFVATGKLDFVNGDAST